MEGTASLWSQAARLAFYSLLANSLTSLHLSLLICKMELITIVFRIALRIELVIQSSKSSAPGEQVPCKCLLLQ